MNNITLIGMPSSGKSALGRIIAKKQEYEFIDGDRLIEDSGRTLPQIIEQDGDYALLKIEEEVLLGLSGTNKIFSPGGSCIYSKKAMEHINEISLIVFLDVPYELIKERLDKKGVDKVIGLKEKTLKELFDHRRKLYLKYANLIVELDNMPTLANANILFQKIKEFQGDNL